MCYMVSDNPSDPNSWVFKGYYGPGVAGNNHSHLQKFKDKYYHIYHDHGSVLLDAMKSAKVVDSSAGDYRSICINEATVNESTATVDLVTLNRTGTSGISYMNPYLLQEAETMASSGGIEYEDFTNIQKNTSISALGNDASRNLQVKMKAGSWVNQRRIDFGSIGADRFMLRAKGTGTLESRTSRTDATKFQGIKSFYFVVTAADNFYVDAWQFTEVGSTGIQPTPLTSHPSPLTSKNTYDLSGRRLSDSQQHHGIIIKNGKKIWH